MVQQNLLGLVGVKIARIESLPTSVEVIASSGKKYVFSTHPASTCTHTDLGTVSALVKSQARTTSATLSHKAELQSSGMHYTSTICLEYSAGKIVLEWDLITREYLDGLVSYAIE